MNFMKKKNCLLQKSKWFPIISEKIAVHSKQIHQKSSPPLIEKSDTKLIEESKSEEVLPVQADRIQRNIFGATILPQNLSFENSKKLTENQVKLEDIPLVDENGVNGKMLERRLKGKWANYSKENKKQPKEPDDPGVIVIETSLRKSKGVKKPSGELLWVADAYEEIPGPNAFGNVMKALKFSTRQLTAFSLLHFIKSFALSAYKTYGPIVRLPEILGGKIVLISRPEHIYNVFEQDQRYPINSMLDSIQRSRLLHYEKNEHTRYHLNEKEWENLKKFVKKPLIKGSEKYFEGIEEVSGKFLRKIKIIRNKQYEVPDDFLYEINKWSLECLCYVIFDKSYGFLDFESTAWPSKTSQMLYSLTVATKNLCQLERGFQLWRFMNTFSLSSLSSACDILENNISEYVAQVQLDLVRKSKNSDEKLFQNLSLVEGLLLESGLPPDDIVNNILDTLLIGINTMSVGLGFLIYHLSRNPRVQGKLWKEVKEILPEKYSKLEYNQLDSLKYLQACLKESLRLKMPLPILTRVLSRNVLLNNYQIPKGTFVLMTPQIEGMKEENFNDPTEFLPERWLDQEFSHPYTALPTRNYFVNSFERRLAEASVWVCAAQIVRNFYIEYFYEDIEATNTVISFPNKPLKFTFVERKN